MKLGMQKALLQALVISLVAAAPLAPVHAVIVGTDAALAMSERADVLDRVNAALMRDDVRAQLEALGVDPAQALERVQSLTAAELAQLDTKLQELPAGGSVIGVLGALLVVLIVLELLGVTNVFTGL
ncbi:MAG: PA2779 family protein [Pseudomonadales bacterium]